VVTSGPLSSRFTIDDLSALAFGEDLADMTARELQADIGALGRHSWFVQRILRAWNVLRRGRSMTRGVRRVAFILDLAARVREMEERLSRLEAQARQDSRTSSKPPSMDAPKSRAHRRAQSDPVPCKPTSRPARTGGRGVSLGVWVAGRRPGVNVIWVRWTLSSLEIRLPKARTVCGHPSSSGPLIPVTRIVS
jgi:hypothetical protein